MESHKPRCFEAGELRAIKCLAIKKVFKQPKSQLKLSRAELMESDTGCTKELRLPPIFWGAVAVKTTKLPNVETWRGLKIKENKSVHMERN